ncbi:helix-hairpin-helix domain-containing protein [Fannyhessea vaginae]|uniref:ComEA protein n=1 Tax=Fannyhessea vaginae DSM 15829 TaxID=525256 RepID=F1T4U9_9ACTN|nr:helix-hairpin-helix domain-containing protein [Fannyhessea vaginae]EGF23743.1 comEA protein [Fannyhessea vaginae DSM 15829]QPR42063.1 helix-hairpin-helix domain-containing protein [Fannyhessea vaginae]SSZ05317.1 ComE operon protein 1 [Fannyhessea vaginae]
MAQISRKRHPLEDPLSAQVPLSWDVSLDNRHKRCLGLAHAVQNLKDKLIGAKPEVIGCVVGVIIVIACIGWWICSTILITPVPLASTDEISLSPNASEENDDTNQAKEDAQPSQEDTSQRIVIYIDGCVAHPDVYELSTSARVKDSIDRAGGLTSDADVAALNLASELHDGEKVHIPRVGEDATLTQDSTGAASGDSYRQDRGASTTRKGHAPTRPISLNKASKNELLELPGVGPAMADRIIADRREHGPFKHVEDLKRVKGIGSKKFEKVRKYLHV